MAPQLTPRDGAAGADDIYVGGKEAGDRRRSLGKKVVASRRSEVFTITRNERSQ